jgi:DUF1680 family protein
MPLYLCYRFKDGVAMNLYNAAEADIRLAPDLVVSLKQETRYPSDGQISITVSPSRPARFPLFLRVPRWCKSPRIVLNGEEADATIDREWQAGDRIEIDFPMAWRFVKGKDLQAGRATLMRGPVVFTLSRLANTLPAEMVLRDITLAPESIEGPVVDESIRPDGQACFVDAWSPDRALTESPDLRLKLTEYTDPEGEEVFFRLPADAASEEDELLT